MQPTNFKKISAVLLLCMTNSLYAANSAYYEAQHTEGWHWYQKEDNASQEVLKPLTQQAEAHPVATMHTLHRALEYTLDRAILHPTPDNLQRYMQLQHWVSQQSDVFSQQWQHTLLQAPKLNYQLRHPTASVARRLALRQRDERLEKQLSQWAKTHGLLFFYRGDCPYCHRFAPILKKFIRRYHVHLVPIRIAGQTLKIFPHSQQDNGQAKRLHVQYYPALFSVDMKAHHMKAVGYGLMSQAQLKQTILTSSMKVEQGLQRSRDPNRRELK